MNSLFKRGHLLLLVIAILMSSPLLASGWASFAPVQEALQGAEPKTEGLKLDLPFVSEDGSSVPLEISFEGQLEEGDRIQTIRVFATKNPNPEVIDFHFQDSRLLPNMATRVRLNETQKVIAVATSEAGQVWVAEQEVRVTVSGCLMSSDADQNLEMQNPRVALPRRISQGQVAEVRTLINHPMETGLREDDQGELLAQNLVDSLVVNLGDNQAIKAQFYTGVSANPYLRLQIKLSENTQATFIWEDQKGQQRVEERSLNLR